MCRGWLPCMGKVNAVRRVRSFDELHVYVCNGGRSVVAAP